MASNWSCINADQYGESVCKYAEFDVRNMSCGCTHECVNALSAKLDAERRARMDAESMLEKYRKAIRPFVANCRAVIAAVEGGARW